MEEEIDEEFEYSQEQSQTTLAYRLKWFLGTTRLGFIIEVSDIFFSLVYCINYVLQTYHDSRNPAQDIVTAVCLCTFSLHFMLELLVSTERVHYLRSPACLLNLLSMAPAALLFMDGGLNIWKRLLRLCEVLRIFHLGVIAKFMKTEINQQLFRYCALLYRLRCRAPAGVDARCSRHGLVQWRLSAPTTCLFAHAAPSASLPVPRH